MFELLSTFFIISLTGALSPGPLTTMAIAEGARSKWSGWWLAVGHGLAEGAYVGLLALLLWLRRDALLQQPLVAGAIALGGGIFLAWMGWSLTAAAWRRQLILSAESPQKRRFGLVPTGIFFSLSNPYWWLWWVLMAPLYIRPALAGGLAGVGLLFFVHWLTDLGWLTGLAWLTGSGRGLVKPDLYRWVILACGGLLLFFGLSFIAAGLRFWLTGQVGLEV
jgi:threonine/homoserine/homoserine lactone efflux protein